LAVSYNEVVPPNEIINFTCKSYNEYKKLKQYDKFIYDKKAEIFFQYWINYYENIVNISVDTEEYKKYSDILIKYKINYSSYKSFKK
jgi:hypothetical protein